MEKYKLSPIGNFYEALKVREIRNECREFMTNDTSKISFIKQVFWYFKVYKEENKKGNLMCYIFKNELNNSGFALVRRSSGRYWITGGLKSSERGKGLGKTLFKNLIKVIPTKEIWLEVLDSNIAAKKIYSTLGFKKLRKKDSNGQRILVMRLNK